MSSTRIYDEKGDYLQSPLEEGSGVGVFCFWLDVAGRVVFRVCFPFEAGATRCPHAIDVHFRVGAKVISFCRTVDAQVAELAHL